MALGEFSERLYQLLIDGGWRSREWIVGQMLPTVHPGQAARTAEAGRSRSKGQLHTPPPEKRARNHGKTVEVGARAIIVKRLNSLERRGSLVRRQTKAHGVEYRLTSHRRREVLQRHGDAQ